MKNLNNNHTIVIGAGLAGLTAAYYLSINGYQVTLVDRFPISGGLASTMEINGEQVERFYHFICQTDSHLLKFITELNLSDELFWQPTHTAFFHEGKHYPFGTPFDLINFNAVPFIQRLRFGVHILFSRFRFDWKKLDRITGKEWLIRNIGEKAYYVIWHPLLKIKFGNDYDKISAAWIWHRIWRVAKSRKNVFDHERFGYLKQGSYTIISALETKLKQNGVKFLFDKTVNEIFVENNQVNAIRCNDEILTCKNIVSTVALPTLSNFFQQQANYLSESINKIKYIGVVCLLLYLNQKFSNNFWTNTNDKRIPFNGFIELTNLNVNFKKKEMNLLYIPYYLDTKEPRYNFRDEYLLDEYIQALKIINPAFNKSWIKEWFVFRDPYAQAVCTTDFLRLIPSIRTSVNGLYITDSAQFYPEDRTLNSAIRIGKEAADLLMKDFPNEI